MEQNPCGICGVNVLDTDEAVQCDGKCSLWHHRECVGMTLDVYLKLSKGQEDWVCRKCTIKQEIKLENELERQRQKSRMGKAKIECKKLEFLTGTQKCAFCQTTEVDELKYGPIYMHKTIITHYFCLLLSSNMEQNGRDSDGILGFLPNDISKEVNRGKRLYCSYCKSGGATLGCAVSKCKVVFHLPCGLKHSTLHQFFGEFKSFCAKHRPVQIISEKILAESSKGAMCGICYEKVVPRPIHETLWAPCCQKSAFFHRDCVQKLAISAGYFFKCPLCNNTSAFQQAMKDFGIYIPEQDASWECVPHAYQDLLVRHETCDSNNCICPSGRKTDVQGTRWELILCKFCGSQGIHIGCGRLKWKCPEFECDICSKTSAAAQERNSRNYNGNRHRLSGAGRTAEMHPSVSADREGEASESDTSVDSSPIIISNRRKKVLSPVTERRAQTPPRRTQTPPRRSQTPPPTKKSKIEKKSVSSAIVIEDKTTESTKKLSRQIERTSKSASQAIVIDDSDDEDCEILSADTHLRTKDGATIPVVFRHDSVRKRPRVEGDVKILPDEIVDITIQMHNVPRKKSPIRVTELIYSLPQPQPSTSTAYSAPSTSFQGPDLGHFVLVDPTTLRPEDLPPGTMLYRSVQPVVNIPQSQVQQPQLQPQMQTLQPQVQPQVQPLVQSQLPTSVPSNMPMQQLGSAGYADAKYPDLCEYRSRRCHNIHSKHLKKCSTKTSRAAKCDCLGRRGRRRRCSGSDNDRLNPEVLLTPLKCRLSDNGHVEILLPRRKLDLSLHGSMKRKASPLPQRQLKKMKISPKPLKNSSITSDILQIKHKINKCTKLVPNKNGKSPSKDLLYTNSKSYITNFFSPVKIKSKRGRKKKNIMDDKIVRKGTKKTDKEETKGLSSKNTSIKKKNMDDKIVRKRTKKTDKEETEGLSSKYTPLNKPSPLIMKKKRKYKKKFVCMLMSGKCKTLDGFIKTRCDKATNQLGFEECFKEHEASDVKFRSVKSLVDEIIDIVLKPDETIGSEHSNKTFQENLEIYNASFDQSPNDYSSVLVADSSVQDCKSIVYNALIEPNKLDKYINESDSSFETENRSPTGGLTKHNPSLSEEFMAHQSTTSPVKPENKIRSVKSLVDEIIDIVLKPDETIGSEHSNKTFQENLERYNASFDQSPNDYSSVLVADSSVQDCKSIEYNALIEPNKLDKYINESDSSFETENRSSTGGLTKHNPSLSEESMAHQSTTSPVKPENKIEKLLDCNTISCRTIDTIENSDISSQTKENMSPSEDFVSHKEFVSPAKHKFKIEKYLEDCNTINCRMLSVLKDADDVSSLTNEKASPNGQSMALELSVNLVKPPEYKTEKLLENCITICCKEDNNAISIVADVKEVDDASKSFTKHSELDCTLRNEAKDCEVLVKLPLKISPVEEEKCETSDVHEILSCSDSSSKVNHKNPDNRRRNETIGFFPKIKMLSCTKRKAKLFNSKSKVKSDKKHPLIMSEYRKQGEDNKTDEISVLKKAVSNRKIGKVAVNNLSLIDRYFIPMKRNNPVSNTVVADESCKKNVSNPSGEEESRITEEPTNQNSVGKRPLVELQLNAIYNLC